MPEERRVVTVLFADVTGSTALGEESDPEDVRALMGRYYAIARETVGAHGGTLEKFIGDAVMAVFGMPQAHGDDAERALATALALREALARDDRTAALRLRIGVNTGEVVAVRERDAGDFLVTGDAVNVAARLQQHAEPGSILVGTRTRVAVAGSFAFGDERAVEVKGKREPVRAAELRGRVAEHRAPRAPFVGREDDLAQLALVAARAFKERRPRLVTITAPAGTGKSRLVEEFVSRLERATVATAQCLPYGSSVTYLPLRGFARATLGAESDAEIVARAREAFGSAGQTAADAERLASLIGATFGAASESVERDREPLFNAWRLLIEALASRGPLVVVFEDLHWASDSLLDLVEHVTHPRTAAPLVMVALARPELIDRRPEWGGGRKNFTAIGLEPLSDDETRDLVALMTEGVPGAMAERIVERAGGNPFFAGELVRAYEDRKRAGAGDEGFVLPDTVHATVLARIDLLPEEHRAVLEYASVVGRTARVAAVAALLPDRPAAAIGGALEALAERDLLVPQGRETFTFRHIVIREVAYATLPRAQRVQAHLRLAAWLEGYGAAQGEELAELVAYHYRQAIALSPGGKLPEGLDRAKVVSALERAARVAWSGGAFAECEEQLREAVRLSPPEEHLRLLELIGDVVRFGDAGAAGYREAYERWRESGTGDPAVGARLLVKRLVLVGRWVGSLTLVPTKEELAGDVAEARGLLARSPDPLLEARLACAIAFSMWRWEADERDGLPPLVAEVERAVALFAERGDTLLESEALDALGLLYRAGDDWAAAIRCADRRLLNADRLDLLERQDAVAMRALDSLLLGDYAAAARAFDGSRALLRAGESEASLAHIATWSAYGAFLLGEWDDVIRLGDLLIAFREESRIATGRFTAAGWIAAIRVSAARLDDTRLARYRTSLASVAEVATLPPGHGLRWYVAALVEGEIEAADALLRGSHPPTAKAEAISILLFDGETRIDEATLVAVEGAAVTIPAVLAARIALARALNDGRPDALRQAVAALDGAGIVPDAARAAALLAIATRDERDRAAAERRLAALGDRRYVQKLAEELGPVF